MAAENLQTIIVSKAVAKTRAKAERLAEPHAQRIYTSRETAQSWRFRQRPPTDFKKTSFRTFHVPDHPGVTLVYGDLKANKRKRNPKGGRVLSGRQRQLQGEGFEDINQEWDFWLEMQGKISRARSKDMIQVLALSTRKRRIRSATIKDLVIGSLADRARELRLLRTRPTAKSDERFYNELVGDNPKKKVAKKKAKKNPAAKKKVATGLHIELVRSKRGPIYIARFHGKVNRIPVKGELNYPINYHIAETATWKNIEGSLSINRTDGSGKSVPDGVRWKIAHAVMDKFLEMEAKGVPMGNPKRKPTKKKIAKKRVQNPDTTSYRGRHQGYDFRVSYDEHEDDWKLEIRKAVIEEYLQVGGDGVYAKSVAIQLSKLYLDWYSGSISDAEYWKRSGGVRDLFAKKFARNSAEHNPVRNKATKKKPVATARKKKRAKKGTAVPKAKKLRTPRVMPDPGPSAWCGSTLEWAFKPNGKKPKWAKVDEKGSWLWEGGLGKEWLFLWSPKYKAVVAMKRPRGLKGGPGKFPGEGEVIRDGGGAKMFEVFASRPAERTQEVNLDECPLHKLGTGVHIVYRADKWSKARKTTDYIHDFKNGVKIYCGPTVSNPQVFLCFGGKLTMTERGLVF